MERRIIQWPQESTEVVTLEEITYPLVQAARQVLEGGNLRPGYVGYDVGERHVNLSILENLSPEGFEFWKGQGRDALEVIIMLAVQLGIEHGKQIKTSEETVMDIMKRIEEKIAESSQETT